MTIAGGAISFAPPPTPKPSTTIRTGREGGCKPSYVTLDSTPGEGHLVGSQPEGCRLPTDRRRVTRRFWRWTSDYTETDGEDSIGRKREGTGKRHWRARNPGESWRGDKGVPEPLFDVKHSKLKRGTEYRALLSRCPGIGTPPPNNG